jgi:ketosteroid isomerase-like protein
MTDAAVQEVYDLEDRRFGAMSANDLQGLAELLAEDLHYVHANGMVEDKTEFLRKIVSGERRYLQFRGAGRRAHREGGFTFVFGEAEVEVERTAGRLKNRLTYTAIYRDGPGPRFFAWNAVRAIEPSM